MIDLHLTAFILGTLIIPQLFFIRHVTLLDIKLFQFFTFINFLASNVIIFIITIVIFTLNLIIP